MLRVFEQCDCMEGMQKYKDILTSRRVLAIVDPPYGINIANNLAKNKGGADSWKQHKNKTWDNTRPDAEYFNIVKELSTNQIIFGANYFVYNLPSITKGWIIWDKVNHSLTMSDAEIIYSSFNCKTRIYQENFGSERGVLSFLGDIHPTQKSTMLYKWLLENYSKDHDLILDTHVGSASSLIACEEFGIDYIGFELDEDYYRDAKNRLEKARFIRENKTAEECYVNDLALFKDAI